LAADVAFHTGIADPVDYGCRLLRKAVRSGARVAVYGPPALLERLDRALWIFEPIEFLPHLTLPRQGADGAQVARTPILLCADGRVPEGCGIAVAIEGEAPVDASRFARVIEIVGDAPEARQAARQRWRDYERAGLAPKHVNAAKG
jgi:DNA polymerase-3 subunit chi